MRYAKNVDGNRLFTRSGFLTTQQVQSYFSRQAGKLRHQHAEYNSGDHEAAVEQQQYWETRAQILQEVQLQRPVTYDNFNLCAMYHANKLNQLWVSMLKCICEYFDVNNEQLTVRRKAPYIVLKGKLMQSCTCHDQHSHVFRTQALEPCYFCILCVYTAGDLTDCEECTVFLLFFYAWTDFVILTVSFKYEECYFRCKYWGDLFNSG